MATMTTAEVLPASHVFITISRRDRHRTVAIHTAVVWAACVIVSFALLWSVGCTVYVTCHDQLVTALMTRQRDAQYAYEDRIAALRRTLDRTTSEALLARRTVDARLDDLTTRSDALRRKAGSIEMLAGKVARLSAWSKMDAPPQDSTPSGSAALQNDVGSVAVARPDQPFSGADASQPGPPVGRQSTAADRPDHLAETFGTIEQLQARQVSWLAQAADRYVEQDRRALQEAGLQLDRFGQAAGGATGGPFIPLDDGAGYGVVGGDVARLTASLAEAERFDGAIAHIPFRKPLDGAPAITSTFGPRIDPFNGRPALHAGVDLREDTGTAVAATAPGRVTAAGPASGYGIMVEVDHGFGLTTRYAHLSETTVRIGEHVDGGDVVGRVGATGRATGPHLHYETRIDGEPVDPMRFLLGGQQLFGPRGRA